MPQPSLARDSQSICAGAELLALCQTAQPNGRLSQVERARLRAWLQRSAELDVPAPTFVRELIGHVLLTGTITPADLKTLALVFGPSLPPVFRRGCAGLRLAGGDGSPNFDDEASERSRNDLLASARFMLVCPGEKRRSLQLPRGARAGAPVLLAVESRGNGSVGMVSVRTASGRLLGYAPEQRAKEFAPLLDRGARYRAHLVLVSSGVQVPVLIVQVFVYRGDAALGFAQTGAGRLIPRRLSPLSWSLVRAGVALAIAAGAAFALRT